MTTNSNSSGLAPKDSLPSNNFPLNVQSFVPFSLSQQQQMYLQQQRQQQQQLQQQQQQNELIRQNKFRLSQLNAASKDSMIVPHHSLSGEYVGAIEEEDVLFIIIIILLSFF